VNLIHGILCDDEGVIFTKHWFHSERTCPYSWATGRNSSVADALMSAVPVFFGSTLTTGNFYYGSSGCTF